MSDKNLLSKSSIILQNFGWYQIRCFILLSFSSFCIGIFIFSFVFLNAVPPFKCGPLNENATLNQPSNNTEDNYEKRVFETTQQCYRYLNVSETQIYNHNFSTENTTKESCFNELIFNKTNGNNAVSQFGLVCESGWKRPLTTALFMIGMFCGSLFGGRLADRFGRRLISLLSSLVSVVLMFITAFSPYYWLYAFLLYLNGAMHVLFYFSIYTWGIEIAGSPDKRVWSTFSFNASFCLGGIAMSFISYLAKDWNRIFTAEGILFFISFILAWFVPESPCWLIQKERKEEAARVLKDIVKTNKINIDSFVDESESEVIICEPEKTTSKDSSKLPAILLWKNKILRRRMIVVCLICSAIEGFYFVIIFLLMKEMKAFRLTLFRNMFILSYYTMALNSANLGGSTYLNNIIGNALDITALAATTFALKKRGRKATLVFGIISFGCFCIATPIVKKRSEVAGMCLAMFGRFFAMAVMMVSILFSGELFPTMLRSTSSCIFAASSRTAGILCPFLVFAGEELDLSIPFYVMGGISFASVYLVLLLPETSRTQLVNTMKDALALKEPGLIPNYKIYNVKSKRTQSEEKRKSDLLLKLNVDV